MVSRVIVVNWMAWHRGIHRARLHFLQVTVLACFYWLGYLWLLMNPGGRLVWSQFFSGVSLFAWHLVWANRATDSIRGERERLAKLDEVRKLAERPLPSYEHLGNFRVIPRKVEQ